LGTCPCRPAAEGEAEAEPSDDKFIAQCKDVEVLSSLDLQAVPPFIYAHDHFGYRDRLSQPVIEGTDEVTREAGNWWPQ
jgi:hypothetical protein